MKIHYLAFILLAGFAIGCNDGKGPKEGEGQDGQAQDIRLDTISYMMDTTSHQGYVAYDASKKGKRPVVFVVHEWWGVGQYAQTRAKQLAGLGYLAFAVDMYGNQKQGPDPQSAGALAGPFYQNPALTLEGLNAAMARISQHELADTSKMAAIGYCFGGYTVINAAKLGANLKGVVSFHGDLVGAPADKSKLKAAILVCHGEADHLVPLAQVEAFRKSMDSIGANYTLHTYPNATHSFTNPTSTETGKKFNLPIAYNPAADTASWNHMKSFLSSVLK
jgi:dienelactone hydrolase